MPWDDMLKGKGNGEGGNGEGKATEKWEGMALAMPRKTVKDSGFSPCGNLPAVTGHPRN
jgi:hypothetical protein